MWIQKKAGWIFTGYIAGSLLLFLYSFTQVDLSLTLTEFSVWQRIQQFFQHVGFFQRPLSTALYVGILSLWFVLYGVAVSAAESGKLTAYGVWRIALVITALLWLSYPAFSYDIFNYMFTAKTVLVYHKNPYLVIPLDFTGVEPWLSFMRWTHLPSAYTPLWILTTLPFYLMGFGYFLPILWSIKLITGVAFLWTVSLIGQVVMKVEPKKAALGMAIFALNPLVVIETLVSGHNDILMMALVLWAVLLMLEKKNIVSWIILSLSAAAKLMTVFVAPVMIAYYGRTFKAWRQWLLAAMMVGFILVCTKREVLPWYWVWIMPFVALLPSKRQIFILSVGVSLGLLLRYAPYLYLGHWDPPVPVIKLWVTWVPIVISAIIVLFKEVRRDKGITI
ncbi:DUF2029 domain-containing protein [Patescibacteria group bacterium]|nr:DUF2029 domain-containing protein [Patescibacteria group bacterium]MBU1472740.1 DUF2029 domain-containing protein [Patescibacteria group bacterium]MBU2460007.1 DUF2029 domain-containing protein [Patescibacteria group bacterium]MBU2544335.1 DUF2029 domain-containing protein [Patescibacteria group bacterium]